MKWRKRLWKDGFNHCPPHYWLLKTPIGEVLVSNGIDGWVASINYVGTDTDVEIGWGGSDEQAKRGAERNLRIMSARLAKLVGHGR